MPLLLVRAWRRVLRERRAGARPARGRRRAPTHTPDARALWDQEARSSFSTYSIRPMTVVVERLCEGLGFRV